MKCNVGSVSMISLIVIGFLFSSPLSTNLQHVQSQQNQTSVAEQNKNFILSLPGTIYQKKKTGMKIEDEIDKFYTPDAIIHAKIADKERLKNVSKDFIRAFPDMKATPQVIVAEKDLVGVLWTFNGTHKGTYLGIPANGKPVSFKMAEFMKIKNGTVKEYWNAVDGTDLLLDIGYLVHHNATNTKQ